MLTKKITSCYSETKEYFYGTKSFFSFYVIAVVLFLQQFCFGFQFTGFLVESKYVSDLAATYIQKIEEILDKDYSELEEFLDEISKVELRALENLTGTDLDNVMYFAESTKTIFAYFSEIDDDSVDARGLKSWAKKKIKRNAKRIYKACVSAFIGVVKALATGSDVIKGAAAGANAGYKKDAVVVSGTIRF